MARRNSRSVTESIVKYSGCPTFLGTIDFTNVSKTNGTATTPFSNGTTALAGKILVLQPDQDVFFLPVAASATAITSTNGMLIFANERIIVTMPDLDIMSETGDDTIWLAAIRSTASGNLKVWELT